MKMQWKRVAEATSANDFGHPILGSTSVALCLYSDSDELVQEFVVDRGGAACDGGKDCWKAKGSTGHGYKDKISSAQGVSQIGFKGGDPSKGSASAKGKNNSGKGQTALPTGVVALLAGQTAPTIQLLTSDGLCLGATMSEVKKDDGEQYKAQLK